MVPHVSVLPQTHVSLHRQRARRVARTTDKSLRQLNHGQSAGFVSGGNYAYKDQPLEDLLCNGPEDRHVVKVVSAVVYQLSTARRHGAKVLQQTGGICAVTRYLSRSLCSARTYLQTIYYIGTESTTPVRYERLYRTSGHDELRCTPSVHERPHFISFTTVRNLVRTTARLVPPLPSCR